MVIPKCKDNIMEQDFCLEKYNDIYGWNALYDASKSSVLSAGIILCCSNKPSRRMLFELDEDVDLFNTLETEALPGSLLIDDGDGEGWHKDDPVAKIPLAICRFPTKTELEEYEKLVGV